MTGRRRGFLACASLGLLSALAGCAGGGQRTLPEPSVGTAPAAGMARVAVTRTQDMLYFGLAADVSINDQRAGSVFRGERTSADVPAGITTVAVSAFGSPGRFVVRFPTVPGGIYDIETAPRGAQFAPTMLFGYAGAMLDAAANPEQGGSFTLTIASASPPVGTTAPAAPAAPPIATTAGDREERLAELRRLRAQSLISEDVYREEQRRVLAPLTGGR